MQVPYAGSEFESAQKKAQQASRKLTDYASTELDGYLRLKRAGCRSTPQLLNHKISVALNDFWKFSPIIREQIRSAFKVAWEECAKTGVLIRKNHGDIFWCETSQKIYFTALHECRPLEKKILDGYRMACMGSCYPPRGYYWCEETNPEPDKTSWKM